jgi:hypothetical protein
MTLPCVANHAGFGSVPKGARKIIGTRYGAGAFFTTQEARRIARLTTEENMPVILLWGIPTLIVIGGGAYWIAHLH